MALTSEQRKTLLILEVGDTTGGLLAANIDLLWEKYGSYAPVSADLRDLYVKIGLIDIALGAARQGVTFTDGDYSQSASHVAQRLLEMRRATTDELAVADAASGGTGVTSGQLTTVTPQTPPSAAPLRPYGPDALDPEYVGSPYWGRNGGRRW